MHRQALRAGAMLAGAMLALPCTTHAQDADPGRHAVRQSTIATVVPVAAGILVAAGGSGGTGSTVASAVLMWGGAIAGPAAGYVLADRGALATTGVVVRAATFAAAWAIAPTRDFDDGFLPNPQLEDTMLAWVIAVPVIAGSAVWDIATAGRRIRRNAVSVGVLPAAGGGVRVAVSVR